MEDMGRKGGGMRRNMGPRRSGGSGHKDQYLIEEDPLSGGPAEVRVVQPFQASKRYICPGCNQTIEVGQGHVVVVPTHASDLRRHWHSPCWTRRDIRHPR